MSSQERERRGSVGCLVTDGHTTYALTNGHVCGEPGQRILSFTGGRVGEVGTSAQGQLYLAGSSARVSQLGAGDVYLTSVNLVYVEVDDVNHWTSSVYGLGEVGPLADLNEQNLGLQLIDQPVVADWASWGTSRARSRRCSIDTSRWAALIS